ncbi:helix-turn-helix domain-containing protein [Dactylosporangium sp. NPDC000555]|uniref:helix-turn-helix domain-containing protein n=1 Tax=Dactylosporangium sp. NPDC000555 TaxID=3154260 RepID=UPI00332936BA
MCVLEILAQGGTAAHLRQRIGAAVAAADDKEGLQEAADLALALCTQLERHQHHEKELASLVDLGRELTAPLEFDALLRLVARRARLLIGADIAYIALRADGATTAQVRVSDGHVSTLNIGLHVPMGAGLGSEVLSNPSPTWSADYMTDARIRHNPAVDEAVRAEGLHAILATPLSGTTGPFGALYVGIRTVRNFTRDEVALVSSIGDLAGAAIQRALNFDETRQAAAAETGRAELARAEAVRLRERLTWEHELFDLVLASGSPQDLLDSARERLGGALRLIHVNGSVIGTAGELPGLAQADEEAYAMAAHAAAGVVPVRDDLHVTGIRVGQESLGTLFHHGPVDTDMLAAVAAVVAVLLARPGKNVPPAGEGRSDVLDDMLAEPQIPPQQLERRAERIGLDLSTPHLLLVIALDGRPSTDVATWTAMRAHRVGGLATSRNGAAVLMVPGTDPGATARAVHAELSPLLRGSMTVGAAGPVQGPAAVYHGYREARRCVEAMNALGLAGNAGSARELGFFGVLLSDNRDVDGFVEATIGPVLEYDQLRATDLAHTLDAYFETGGSPTYAAQRLHVHANTVARRLERITELLGTDWQKPERQLEVHLALRLARIRRLIGTERPDTAD